MVVKASAAEITSRDFGRSRNLLISSWNSSDSARASLRRVKEGKRGGKIGEGVTIR